MRKALHAIYGGPWYKRILVWLLTLIVLFFLFLVSIDCNLFGLYGSSPTMDEIRQADTYNDEASEIYSADSVLLGRYFTENRSTVSYDELSPILIQTLVDTEDERFFTHNGIDIIGLFAALKDMTKGNARGASTITQQLAKNLFVRTKKNSDTGIIGNNIVIKKMKEWIIATKLEHTLTKEEILTMYLNTVDFGCNSYGIKTACRTYFGTTPSKLTYEQAAVLVGLLKATSYYNPRTNPKNSLERRNTILKLLFGKGHITIEGKTATKAQLDSLKALPIKMESRIVESSNDGIAPYFRRALTEQINHLCDAGYIDGYDKDNPVDLCTDGLRIHTTLDTRMQAYAEEATREQMAQIQDRFDKHWKGMNPWRDEQFEEIPNFLEDLARKTGYYKYFRQKYNDNYDSIFYHLREDKHPVTVYTFDGAKTLDMSVIDSIRHMVSFMHCGMVAIEPHTRHVKAWVGDIDFNSWQYDKVTAMRQPGSTFKLFVYAEALRQGLTPDTRRPDRYVEYPDTTADGQPCIWAPHNADGHFTRRNITLTQAFAQSVNSVAVHLGYECGIENIARTAKAMGIHSKMELKPSLSLGSSDTNLLELTNAYCTPIDKGCYSDPVMITKIEDRYGNTLYEAREKSKQAITEETAQELIKLLHSSLSGICYEFRPQLGEATYAMADWGGKTGTSNNHSDAWFVGVTPKLVCGCWVGGEYRSIHFRTGAMGQGSKTAMPVCGDFMKRVFNDSTYHKYHAQFPILHE